MRGSKLRLGRMVWLFLLSGAACLASGDAFAACTVSASSPAVPCYIKVQPIDVCPGGTSCARFNPVWTTSTVDPSTAGNPSQPLPSGFLPPAANPPITAIPNNPASANPIGFVVNPDQGLGPGQSGYSGPGVDIARALLNNIGVDLVWLPMRKSTANFGTVQIRNVLDTTAPTKTCTGFISGTTLTVTSAGCSTGSLALNDFLVWSAGGSGKSSWSASPNPPTTFISALGTGSGGTGTYTVANNTVSPPPTLAVASSKTPITITAKAGTVGSQDFLTLSQQDTTVPCAISTMTIPPTGSCVPVSPLSSDPATINLFFVNNLLPAGPGTLYGFSWIGNNGVVIGSNTFVPPTPLDQPRPDTIAHELLHNLGLEHTTYGAGPYTSPNNLTTNPPSYTAPAGVAPPFPFGLPKPGACDPTYPACGANLMTTGASRNGPTKVACILARYNVSPFTGTIPGACKDPVTGVQTEAGLFNPDINLMADQVTSLPDPPFDPPASTAQLPTTQDQKVLNGGSGLLFSNNPALQFSGLIDPIPHETTKAQLGTGGSSTDQVIFDLSSPIGGTPGETLVAWALTLPEGQTFARRDQFQILSKSRADLVHEVKYYPDYGDDPLLRNIAYNPDADKQPDNPSTGMAGPGLCASAAGECLVVEFQPPGLGSHDRISFSKSILSGGAPITNDELCRAKITYVFSDGFTTTSNFGRCPAESLPLIASSWYPDPQVAPQIIKPNETNVLLASVTPAPPLIGYAYLNNAASTDARIGFSHGTPDVIFSVPSPNSPDSVCTGGATLCFKYNDPIGTVSNPTLAGYLASGGATILSDPNHVASNSGSLANTVFEFTGIVTVANGQLVQVLHDDGLQLQIGSNLVIDAPAPTSPTPTTGTYTGDPGTFAFDLVYGECCGGQADLVVSLPLYASLPCSPVPGSNPPVCPDATKTPPADIDVTQEVQPNQTCDNGATFGKINVSGTIVGPQGGLQINAGQRCNYTNCTIVGNLTIDGGQVYLNCTLNGNLTVNSGLITLGELAYVGGNVQISQSAGSTLANGFRIGNSTGQAFIKGGLTIQNLLATQTVVPTGGSVCNTQVGGSITVQNNTTQSAIEIGEPMGQDLGCPGNIIGGQLLCTTNSPKVISGGNMVQGSKNTCG